MWMREVRGGCMDRGRGKGKKTRLGNQGEREGMDGGRGRGEKREGEGKA